MAEAGIAGQGVNGNVTAPAGTLVTSWARRSFIESVAGYGWTFESGSNTSTAPTVVAEIRSSDGSAKFAGSVTAAQFNGSGEGLWSLHAGNLSIGTIPDARLSGTYTGMNITGNAATATKLATARTINGVAFDGTANITIADATKLPLTGGTVTGTIVNNGARYAIEQNGEIGGSYVSWNNGRMYTVQVSCSSNDSAYGGIRWTKWGERHLGAIDCFAGGTNSSAPRIDFHVGNTANAFVFQQGGHFVAAGSVTAYSDIRLKKDIRVIPDALAKVEQLSGVTYERIDSGERQVGVIAQEVQKVLPEAVIQGDEYLSVAYGNMVGLLIESIKELNSKVGSLQKELDELRRAT